MSQASSTSARRCYGLALVCRVWELARSSVYAGRAQRAGARAAPSGREAWSQGCVHGRGTGGPLQARDPGLALGWGGAPQGLGSPPTREDPNRPAARSPLHAGERAACTAAIRSLARPAGTRPQHHARPPERAVGHRHDGHAHGRGPRLDLLRHRPLHCGVPGRPRGSAWDPLRSPGATEAGSPPTLRRVRPRHRSRSRPAPRPRVAVRVARLPGRAAPAGAPVHSLLRPRAPGERLCRTLRPHAEGAAAVAPALQHRRGG